MSSGKRPVFRRSASAIAAGAIFLAVTSCGVDFNGLFEGGDAGGDATLPDAAQDVLSPTDGRVDANSDGSSSEPAIDAVGEDAGRDASRDAAGPDVRLDAPFVDATLDARLDGDARGDVSFDGDARDDVGRDVDASQDLTGEPVQDVRSEDASGEVRLDTPNETNADVGPSDGADAGPPGTCSGVCNTFANISQVITRTVEAGPPPPMTGGTIIDGTYVSTAAVNYNDDMQAYSIAETSIIFGNVDTWVVSTNGGTPTRVTTTFTAMNGQMTFDQCCPTPLSYSIDYTTDGTTLSYIDPLNANRVITFTRQ